MILFVFAPHKVVVSIYLKKLNIPTRDLVTIHNARDTRGWRHSEPTILLCKTHPEQPNLEMEHIMESDGWEKVIFDDTNVRLRYDAEQSKRK